MPDGKIEASQASPFPVGQSSREPCQQDEVVAGQTNDRVPYLV